jgi:hypothetical protein
MSEAADGREIREIVGPKKLDRAETGRSIWYHSIPENVPHTDCFSPDYWRRATGQLKGGDRIECITADRRTLFEIFVLERNPQADPARIDMVFRSIYPPGLKVPAPIVEPARWVIKQRGTDSLFFILDTLKGETIADGLRRESAQQQVALLEKLARETSEAA